MSMKYIRVLPAEFQTEKGETEHPDRENAVLDVPRGFKGEIAPNCFPLQSPSVPLSQNGSRAQSSAQPHNTRRESLHPFTCQECGATFHRKKKGKKVHKYCSVTCCGQAKTGKPAPGFITPESEKVERIRANGLVNMRLRRGWFKRPMHCMRCGRKRRKLDSHHTDYSKPDHVYWLCRSCHVQSHHTPSILNGIEPFVCYDRRVYGVLPEEVRHV